jgi:hypothetical protein
VEEMGQEPDAVWTAAAGRQEPWSDGHDRAAAPTCRTGTCPLGQGRAGGLMAGPRTTVPNGGVRFDFEVKLLQNLTNLTYRKRIFPC